MSPSTASAPRKTPESRSQTSDTLELASVSTEKAPDRRSVARNIMESAATNLHFGKEAAMGTVKSIASMVDAMAQGWLKQDDKSLPGDSRTQNTPKNSSEDLNLRKNVTSTKTQSSEELPIKSYKKEDDVTQFSEDPLATYEITTEPSSASSVEASVGTTVTTVTATPSDASIAGTFQTLVINK